MKSFLILAVLVALAGCSHAPPRAPLKANDQFGRLDEASGAASGAMKGARVILIPQWHLSPQTSTVYTSAGLPQTENQLAIYRQLVGWVESSQVKTVVVEGCEGEIDDNFRTRFNGWGLEDLSKLSAQDLDGVMTNVGLKIKAKVGAKARVVCGDNLALVTKHQLVLSDLRGLVGFKSRLDQYKDDPVKSREYLSGVRAILKLPANLDAAETMAKLNDEILKKLVEFKQVLRARNEVFARTAKFAAPTAAVVIGAIHLEDLSDQLKTQNVATSTFEPRGLKGDESELLKALETLLAKPQTK